MMLALTGCTAQSSPQADTSSTATDAITQARVKYLAQAATVQAALDRVKAVTSNAASRETQFKAAYGELATSIRASVAASRSTVWPESVGPAMTRLEDAELAQADALDRIDHATSSAEFADLLTASRNVISVDVLSAANAVGALLGLSPIPTPSGLVMSNP